MTRAKADIDPAPHGYDDDGNPKAPYGLNADGSPRKSNRGRRAGAQTSARKSASTASVSGSKKDAERKGMLVDLVNMLVVAPLASASQAPILKRRLGDRHTDALAGDAFILASYFPHVADGLILLSKTKPQTLAWLDKAEENAPYLVLASAGLQLAKAVADNHLNPNPEVAKAGRNMAAIHMAQMAEQVNAEAERYTQQAAQPVGV